MRDTTRRTILKGLAGAGASTAVSGFPFVNRLALGQEPIKLGVVVPITGPMALEAQEMLVATQIAVEDVNAAGGVLGRKVEMVVRDSEFKPEVAKRKATELIEVEKAPFLVGALVGFEGIAMAEVGCKSEVVVSFFHPGRLQIGPRSGIDGKGGHGQFLTPRGAAPEPHLHDAGEGGGDVELSFPSAVQDERPTGQAPAGKSVQVLQGIRPPRRAVCSLLSLPETGLVVPGPRQQRLH